LVCSARAGHGGAGLDVESGVVSIRTPDGGIQPQAAVDEKGTLHVIYFRGNPAGGDIYYVRRMAGDEGFSTPIRVNSRPSSAIATGTIRGAHLAVGRAGRVHVSWMGSRTAEPRGPNGASPMLYTRLDEARTAFEPQRNVLQVAAGLDGGGSVAADRTGHVYVAWHANGDGEGERNRRVWIARSDDDGRTFARETAVAGEPTGACGCCGMRAFADAKGILYVLYRAATEDVHRDMYLLTSSDHATSFRQVRLQDWEINACPMSTASLHQAADAVVAAWETKGQVYFAMVDSATSRPPVPIAALGPVGRRKHPAVASNARGETLLVWTEDTGWNKGGSLAWQVYGRDGRPTGVGGSAGGVAVWSLPAAAVLPDGRFVIVY